MGIILLIIGIRNTIRLANTELLYEMSCPNEDGAFFLSKEKYGLYGNKKDRVSAA
ncbi:hypothetical protein [Haemophilus pittmaniae]|uniref:hypothetical protein n=1 Tax=Haemophilus pittmaniae TaxID=249188 RepID=UPI0028DCE232|nr:hypothetical protein [Haemophilus pittmaniae]